jgi:hypothetical protein
MMGADAMKFTSRILEGLTLSRGSAESREGIGSCTCYGEQDIIELCTAGRSTMSGFTEEIRRFLASQRIAESEVLDASQMSPRSYKAAMRYEGKLFALVSRPCYDGHYLKSRSGHCIQCDTARIEFTRRHYKEAYVYIAGSKNERVLKIGSTENPGDKASYLNTLGYGGIVDWKLLYHVKVPQAGKVEFRAHELLSAHVSPRQYFREGWQVDCREIFACAYVTARKALTSAVDGLGTDEWEYRSAPYLYGFVGYLLREQEGSKPLSPMEP